MPPLAVIVGETASGKSALAMELARKFDGELICADSWTVYKGFDIGTAKPTREEREQVPHHLLDVADPREGFSAAEFQRLAKAAIEDIASRGKLPILVGGTGLYIDCIIYDYSFLPPGDPKRREELNGMSLEALIAKADELELDSTGIDMRNKRRIIRLIENNGVRPSRSELRLNTLLLGVKRSGEELHERIEQRIDAMIATGFAGEVWRLGEAYGWSCEPMQAPNYRVFKDFVNRHLSLAKARERCVQNDLQLAKKQRTWFKRNNSIQWLNGEDSKAEAVDIVATFLNNQP
jgi:tRNA dimethylallyltransferase